MQWNAVTHLPNGMLEWCLLKDKLHLLRGKRFYKADVEFTFQVQFGLFSRKAEAAWTGLQEKNVGVNCPEQLN